MVEKMKKSLLWCLVCLVCLIPCSGAALAAEADAAQDAADGYVYDAAGLLTADEISDLNDEIASFMEESGWNVYAVTTDDAQGKSATAYADDFFDEHSTEQEDGVVLLIDMDNREITISTCGIAIRYLTDSRIDNILDAAYAKISNGDYNGCMHSMLTGVENYYEKGISEGQYNYDSETGEDFQIPCSDAWGDLRRAGGRHRSRLHHLFYDQQQLQGARKGILLRLPAEFQGQSARQGRSSGESDDDASQDLNEQRQ